MPKAKNLNGFTDSTLYNLTIQKSLLLDSNGDTVDWELSENILTSAFEINRNDSTILSIDTSGNLTVIGGFSFTGDLTMTGDIDMSDNDILNVRILEANDSLLTLRSGSTISTLGMEDSGAVALWSIAHDNTDINFKNFVLNGDLKLSTLTGGSGVIEFAPLESVAMTLDSNGDLGVNVSAPTGDQKIEVNGEVGGLSYTCRNLGTLGCVLLDEQTYSTGSYDDNTWDLDNGNTGFNFTQYLFRFRFNITGDGGAPAMRIRYHDTDGGMATAAGHYFQIVTFGGTSVTSNTNTYATIGQDNTSHSAARFGTGHLQITLDGASETHLNHIGQISFVSNDGATRAGENVYGGLTNAETINTRVVAFGINIANQTAFNIYGRVYRYM